MNKKVVLLLIATVFFVAFTVWDATYLNTVMNNVNSQSSSGTPIICEEGPNGDDGFPCAAPSISWADIAWFVVPLIISLGLIAVDTNILLKKSHNQK